MVVNTMFVDVKHYFHPYYSKVVGVNVDSLIVYFFDNKEMALDNELCYQAF
jgi:RecA/RadA recombinase